MTITVVVCTNRPLATLQPCLDGLRDAGLGAQAVVVQSGMSGAAAEEHRLAVEGALPGVRVVAEPRRGLSRARNAGLRACETEVVAFLDDDAVPGEGWHDALRRAWADAAPAVACIGGPVRARFLGERPSWLGDELLGVLSMLDFGDAPLAVDPRRMAVYGANMSFSVAALREHGGFDERLGAGTPMAVGEDDDVQVRLAAAGRTVLYDPAPWVWHLVPAERLERWGFLRRHARYGVYVGVTGQRPRRLAMRRVLSSAPKIPVAVARGQESAAMEQALKLVENGAALAAPVLHRRAVARNGDGA